MIPQIYTTTKIYAFDDSNPSPLIIDVRLKNVTIVTQPLNLIDAPVGFEDMSSLLTDANSVPKDSAGLAGTVTIEAQPPKTINKFPVGEPFELTDPVTTSTGVPIHRIYTGLNGLSGCTHIAVSAIGYSS